MSSTSRQILLGSPAKLHESRAKCAGHAPESAWEAGLNLQEVRVGKTEFEREWLGPRSISGGELFLFELSVRLFKARHAVNSKPALPAGRAR